MAPKVRVQISVDHRVLRQAVAAAQGHSPGVEVMAVSPGGEVGAPVAARHRPDVIVVCERADGGDPRAWVARSREAAPGARLVMVATATRARDLARYVPVVDGLDDLITAAQPAERGRSEGRSDAADAAERPRGRGNRPVRGPTGPVRCPRIPP